jgi:hypothetical protein
MRVAATTHWRNVPELSSRAIGEQRLGGLVFLRMVDYFDLA